MPAALGIHKTGDTLFLLEEQQRPISRAEHCASAVHACTPLCACGLQEQDEAPQGLCSGSARKQALVDRLLHACVNTHLEGALSVSLVTCLIIIASAVRASAAPLQNKCCTHICGGMCMCVCLPPQSLWGCRSASSCNKRCTSQTRAAQSAGPTRHQPASHQKHRQPDTSQEGCQGT